MRADLRVGVGGLLALALPASSTARVARREGVEGFVTVELLSVISVLSLIS